MTDIEKKMRKRAQDVISRLTIDEKISQLLHEAAGIERLGIKPYNWWSEALHGVARCGRATVFPEPIGIAATFDEDLMYRIGDAVASEGRAKFNIAQSIGNYGEDAGLTYWSWYAEIKSHTAPYALFAQSHIYFNSSSVSDSGISSN